MQRSRVSVCEVLSLYKAAFIAVSYPYSFPDGSQNLQGKSPPPLHFIAASELAAFIPDKFLIISTYSFLRLFPKKSTQASNTEYYAHIGLYTIDKKNRPFQPERLFPARIPGILG